VDMLLGLRVDVVGEVVGGHDHGDNRQTWEGYNPPGGGNEVAAIGNDQAPLGDWWRCAVAQKSKDGQLQDGAAELQGSQGNHRGERVGQDVLKQHLHARGAGSVGGLNKV